MERFADRYLLLRSLGRGGMGEVFLARDLVRGTECALKRLNAGADDESAEQFRREFERHAAIRHPAIAQVYERGTTPDGTPYITMEYVPGLPSDHAIAAGDRAGLAFVAARVAAGLEALHAAGILHGDMKPTNVLVVPAATAGRLPLGVRIVDFGLAGLLGRDTKAHEGTPGYAAPEVVTGTPASAVTDLYGLGATLYHLAAGRAPFADEKPATLLRRQQAAPPPALPLEEAGCPAAMIQLILRLMAVAPGERPQTAGEVRRELEHMHPAARQSLADRLATDVIVGRERELGLIERRLAEAGKRTRVLLMTGAPGAGKSSLLRELATRAALRDQRVVHCSGAGAPARGGAALELLRMIAAGTTPADPEQRAIRERLDDPDAALPEQAVPATVAAAIHWMRRGPGAGLFLIDDAEQMDSLSRTVVRRLMLHPEAPPSLWVLARRGDAGALAEDEALMVRAGVAEHLPVRTLSRDSVARLAAVRLAHPAPEPLVEFLWDRAAGHPGLTVELLRAAAESGALREADTGLGLDAAALAKVDTPGSFEETLLGRLNVLPEPARATALALAIWRRPVAMDRLRAVEPLATESAVDALVGSGLAALDDAGRIGLRPPALAERVIGVADAEVRQRIHRAILELPGLAPAERFERFRALADIEAALAEAERGFAATPDAVLAASAADLAAPSDPAGAARWYERAATERFRQGRAAEVLPLIEQAMTLDPESESRFTRWILLARAQQRAGAPDEALDTIDVALADEPDPPSRARLRLTRASTFMSLGRFDEALIETKEALSEASVRADEDIRAGAALNESGCLIQKRAYREAAMAARMALEIARRTGNSWAEIHAVGNLSLVELLQGRRTEAVALSRDAVAIARSSGNDVALQLQLSNLGSVLTEAGLWEEGREAQSEAFRVSLEHGLRRTAAVALGNVVCMDALRGRPRSASSQARTAARLMRTYYPMGVPLALRAAAIAARTSGDTFTAWRLIRSAERSRSEHAGPTESDWLAIETTRCLLARGNPSRAARYASRVAERSKTQDSTGQRFLLAIAGIAATRTDDWAAAATALATIDKSPQGASAPYVHAMNETLRAIVSANAGNRDACVRAAEVALRAFDRLPAPPDRAWAAYEIARVALSLSEPPAQIGLWLEGAARIFERLGDDRSRARALSLQIRWLRRTGAGPGVADEQHLIEQVSAMLGSFSNPAEVSQRAMAMVVQQLGAERGSLLIIDRESNRLIPVAEIGALDSADKKEVFNYSRQVVKRVTESGVGLVTGDAATDPGLSSTSIRTLGLRSIVCVPVHLGGRVIGAIYADDSRRTGAFSEQDQSLLEGLSHLMAIAIERSREHVEVLATNVRLVDENLSLRRQVGAHHQMDNLVGTSTQMRRVIAEVEQAAGNDARVLVTGEMGTGKELVARTLHYRSRRRMGPFVMLNCGAITETLLASELFGILPDVATGVKARAGRFAEASGGTLFLDEVGEMPMAQQVALLSVLSSPSTKCEVTPVGGGKPVQVDVRVIAATNQDLRARIREGKFREDLFYRLAVIPIDIPPLRERKADIQPLAIRFLGDLATAQQRKAPDMSPEFVAALLRSDWPGNVRELQNYVERVLAMTPGHVLQPKPLPRDLEERAGTVQLKAGRRLGDMVEELERKLIREALDRADGNQSRAARELGLTEQSIRYRIKKYTLDSAREKQRTR